MLLDFALMENAVNMMEQISLENLYVLVLQMWSYVRIANLICLLKTIVLIQLRGVLEINVVNLTSKEE